MHIWNTKLKASFSRIFFRLLAISLFFSCSSQVLNAQWRISTPRDTVTVHANQSASVSQKILPLSSGVDMWIQASSTFTEQDASTTFSIDAAYTYLVNGNILFPEAPNPPTYGGKSHLYALQYEIIPGLNWANFTPIENSYQPNHIYTERLQCLGSKLQFRILADKASDYTSATGQININMARWTAGIAIENLDLNFGNVLIGSSLPLLDSLESYGLDPLQVDSIKIIDVSGHGDFSFISERDKRFTLPTELTNELRITFSPSVRGSDTAEVYIYSHNADPASRVKVITLIGFGIAPSFGVGPHEINFGKVRIGYPAIGFTNVSNASGNTDLHINSGTFYKQVQPPPTVFSFAPPSTGTAIISPGSIGQINTLFSPAQMIKYEGWLQVRGDNVPPDSVHLLGEGAKPIPVLSPAPNKDTLDFGITYNGNTSLRTDTLRNIGNWTASIILARISGSFKSMFSFVPTDTDFIVEPDSARVFTISFHPGTQQDSIHIIAYLELVYDDYSIDTVVLRGIEIEPKILACSHRYDFGRVRIGQSKMNDSGSLCLRNVGNVHIQLQEEEVLPAAGEFSEVGKINGLDEETIRPIFVKFQPRTQGPASAYFYFQANQKRDSILLTGIGALAKSVFNPGAVNLGIVPSNQLQTVTVNLKDSGDYQLVIDSIKILGPDANDFKIIYQPIGTTPVIPPSYVVYPDSSINIEVHFITNALTGAVHQATLCVYYDDGSSDCIPLEAIEEAQYLQFAQGPIDFGKQRIKTHSNPPRSAVFRNGSNTILSVGAVTETSSPDVFAVLDTLNPVKAQSKDSVLVDFFPQVRGKFNGYLHASGNNFRTDSIQLFGQGAAPIPYLPDTVLNFGIVKLNMPFQKPLDLQNNGDWDLMVTNIQLTGPQKDEFSYVKKGTTISVTTDTVPQQGGYTEYEVTFTPNRTIVYHTAILTFTFDDGTQGTVTLIGLDESPKMILDVDSINFGKVRIGALPAPKSRVNIINTSQKVLTAQNIDLVTAAPVGTFLDTDGITQLPAIGPIPIPAQGAFYPIDITFKPSAIGTFTGQFITSGKDFRDSIETVYITGIGAKPIPILSSILLDFGSLFPGYSDSRSFNLTDSGNWPLGVINVTKTGPNAADFTLRNIPSQFAIAENNSQTFIIDFKAVTGYQAAPRTAQIVFMLDDSSTFTVSLTELDIPPIPVDFAMDKVHARIKDYVTPCLRMTGTIPDSLHILDLKGVITYDPLIATLDRSSIRIGDELIALGGWKVNLKASDPAGTITYELQGSGAALTAPGSLLHLKFTPASTATAGSSTPLTHTSFTFGRSELAPQVADGVIIIDSACGNVHIISGPATANMVDQNTPNPFGRSDTQIPFDIGADNTSVTIRILDVSGREVARPVDNQIFNQGRYTAKVSPDALSATGTYFYEFRAGSEAPVFKKMVVNK